MIRPYLVVAVLAAILGMLETNAVGEPLGVVVLTGLVVGIVWTAIAALVANRVGRARKLVHSPDVAALAVAFATAFLLAGGLILHLMFDSPEAYLEMAQGDLASGTVVYYATLNPLNEWVLVPLALFLNWNAPRRRKIVLVAAAIYYAERIWTYLYFAPHILSWPDEPKTPALLDEVSLWLTLDWGRMIINAGMICLFVFVTFRSRAGADRDLKAG